MQIIQNPAFGKSPDHKSRCTRQQTPQQQHPVLVVVGRHYLHGHCKLKQEVCSVSDNETGECKASTVISRTSIKLGLHINSRRRTYCLTTPGPEVKAEVKAVAN